MQLYSNSQTPLYKQVADAINEMLNDGTYRPGDKIPSEDKLCETYGVSRVTLRAAINLLVKEYKLKKMQGKGTFVNAPVFIETKVGGSFTKFCLQIGAIPKTDIISSKEVAASQIVAHQLGIQPSVAVCQICRVRYINNVAAIFEIDYFRSNDGYILHADVANYPIANAIKENTGLEVGRFEDVFDIVQATDEQAQIFRCQTTTPLLLVRQKVLTKDRQILYYNEQYIFSERYKYVVSYA